MNLGHVSTAVDYFISIIGQSDCFRTINGFKHSQNYGNKKG